MLLQPTTVRLKHNNYDYYLSWHASTPGLDKKSLCIGATFARALNIKEGDVIFVTSVDEAPELTSLIVAPQSPQDRAILVSIQKKKIFFNR